MCSSDLALLDVVVAHGLGGVDGGTQMNFIGTYIFTSGVLGVPSSRYLAKFDELSTTESVGSKPRGMYVTNVLFTVDEVLLNRMEAHAMLRNYTKSIDDLLQYMQGKFGFMPSIDRDVYTTTNRNNYKTYTHYEIGRASCRERV